MSPKRQLLALLLPLASILAVSACSCQPPPSVPTCSVDEYEAAVLVTITNTEEFECGIIDSTVIATATIEHVFADSTGDDLSVGQTIEMTTRSSTALCGYPFQDVALQILFIRLTDIPVPAGNDRKLSTVLIPGGETSCSGRVESRYSTNLCSGNIRDPTDAAFDGLESLCGGVPAPTPEPVSPNNEPAVLTGFVVSDDSDNSMPLGPQGTIQLSDWPNGFNIEAVVADEQAVLVTSVIFWVSGLDDFSRIDSAAPYEVFPAITSSPPGGLAITAVATLEGGNTANLNTEITLV